MIRPRNLLLFMLFLSSLTGHSFAQQPKGTISQFSSVDIDGQLQLPSGATGQTMGIQVILKSRMGAEVARTSTDSHGRFSFNNLGPGQYVVTVRQNGYLERPTSVDLTFTPKARIFVDLVPAPSNAQGAPSDTVSADVAALSPDAQDAYKKASDLLFTQKNAEASIPEFKKVEKMEPTFAKAYVNHSMALMQLQKYDDAASVLHDALKKQPNDYSANFMLGMCLNSQQKFADAEPVLKKAISLKVDSAEADYELSRALFGLGRWQEADPLANKAHELAPQFAPVQIVLGNISLRKRDAPTALQHFQEYLKLDPMGPFSAPATDMVNKIQAALKASK